MVLLKGHDERGFVFYTNADSRKGDELAANPRAALLFHWKSLRRQVRIEGPVEPVGDDGGRRLFRHPLARFPARRLGVGPVAPARARDRVRGALRAAGRGLRRRGRAAPAALVGLSRRRPSGSSSGPTAPHRLHERRLFVRGPDGGWTESLLYP